MASPIAILVTSPMLAQGLGPAARGELGVGQSLVSFAVACGAFGQAEVFLAQRRGGGGDFHRSSIVAWLGGSVAAVAAAGVAMSIGLSLWIVLIVMLCVPLLSQQNLWRAVSIVEQRFGGPAFASAIAAVMRISFVFTLWYLGWMFVGAAFAVVQISMIVGAVLALGFFANRAGRLMSNGSNTPSFRTLVLAGAPLLVFNVFTSITLNGSIFALKWLVEPTLLGVYVACSALSLAVLSVSGAFKTRVQAALLRPDALHRFNTEILLAAAASGFAAVIGCFMAPMLVDVLLGSGYERAVPVLRIFAFASAALVLLDIMHGSLAVIGLRWRLVVVSGVGAISSLGGLVFLVPYYGLEGAALSTFLSYSFAALLGWFFVRIFLKSDAAIIQINQDQIEK